MGVDVCTALAIATRPFYCVAVNHLGQLAKSHTYVFGDDHYYIATFLVPKYVAS